jgi:hypothetical protein
MTFLDLYRERYERRGRTAQHFLEEYSSAHPQKVVDFLLEHRAEDVRGALVSTALEFRDTGRTHTNALVVLLQEDRAAMTYERLVADLPELPEPFSGDQRYDTDWAVDRRDLINWVR